MARMSMPDRVARWFQRQVRPEGERWLWCGATTRNGYGQVALGGRHVMAHRAIYEYVVAEIPEGLDLDHLCRNRSCVNPQHLEPVTRSENLRRGAPRGEHLRARTHCPRGHPYDDVNTARRGGRRICRACDRARAYRNREV